MGPGEKARLIATESEGEGVGKGNVTERSDRGPGCKIPGRGHHSPRMPDRGGEPDEWVKFIFSPS